MIAAERTAARLEENQRLSDELELSQEAQRKFQKLLESIPDALVVVNKQGRITLVNSQTEQLFGHTRDELLDEHLEILLPMRFWEGHRDHLAGYFSNPHLRPMGVGLELMACRRDGLEFPVEISLSPLMAEEGLRVSTVIRDISRRKQQEDVLRKSEAKFHALSRRLADAQEAERKVLARELHDRVGQNLTALDFSLNVISSQLPVASAVSDQFRRQVAYSLALVAETAQHIRDVMANLRPPALEDYGLLAALVGYGNQMMEQQGLTITVRGREPEPRLSAAVELALFRISQEAIANTLEHAQATAVKIHLETDADQTTVRLVVADDGDGFDMALQEQPGNRQSWGLIGMVERANAVEAGCRILSAPGQGTQVIVEVSR